MDLGIFLRGVRVASFPPGKDQGHLGNCLEQANDVGPSGHAAGGPPAVHLV